MDQIKAGGINDKDDGGRRFVLVVLMGASRVEVMVVLMASAAVATVVVVV